MTAYYEISAIPRRRTKRKPTAEEQICPLDEQPCRFHPECERAGRCIEAD